MEIFWASRLLYIHQGLLIPKCLTSTAAKWHSLAEDEASMEVAQNGTTILPTNLDQNHSYFHFLHFLFHQQFCLIYFLPHFLSYSYRPQRRHPLPRTTAIQVSLPPGSLYSIHTTHCCQIDPLKTKLLIVTLLTQKSSVKPPPPTKSKVISRALKAIINWPTFYF